MKYCQTARDLDRRQPSRKLARTSREKEDRETSLTIVARDLSLEEAIIIVCSAPQTAVPAYGPAARDVNDVPALYFSLQLDTLVGSSGELRLANSVCIACTCG